MTDVWKKVVGTVRDFFGLVDEDVGIGRDGAHNLTFKDKVVSSVPTLYKLLNENGIIGTDTHEPTGFVSRLDSQVSFDNGTRTFTIEPVVDDFEYYISGIKFTKDAPDQVVIADTEGLHYIFYDGDALTTLVNPTTSQVRMIITQLAIVSIIYWDATNNQQVLLGEERHGCTMDGETHLYLHNYLGAQWRSGAALNNLLTDESGDLDEHAQFGVEAGEVSDEDILLALASVGSTVGLPVYYREGAGGLWRRELNPGFSLLTTGSGRLAWNEFTGGVWQKTEVTNNQFALVHVWAVNDVDYPYIAVMGQNKYATRAAAAEGAQSELETLLLGALPFVEFSAIATVIYQTNDGYGNAVKSRTREVETGVDYVDWRVSARFGGAGAVTDHNSLSGLQGGQAGQYYHLTEAEYNNLGKGAKDIVVSWREIVGKQATYETLARFFFGGTGRLGVPTNIKIYGYSKEVAKPGDIRIYDRTNGNTIAEATDLSSAAPVVFDLGLLTNLPAAEAVFELQLRSPLGDDFFIYSLEVVF